MYSRFLSFLNISFSFIVVKRVIFGIAWSKFRRIRKMSFTTNCIYFKFFQPIDQLMLYKIVRSFNWAKK